MGASEEELDDIVTGLIRLGVRDVLALRGDPPEGEPDWRPHPRGYTTASELVRLLRRVEQRELAIAALRAKQHAGADYAITQVFFDPNSYAAFVRTAREAGIHLPIVPGIIPLTDSTPLRRLETLTGVPVPPALLELLQSADNPQERYRHGLAAGAELIGGVLDAGAPGLHVYTFNAAGPALDTLAAAGLCPARTTS
ncbi:hypothetical protein GCM10027212_14340 [Actinotalea caeni]